ncbi:MAG: formate dehydrogenase subunit delta [Luminiphilus sp.]|nr:formate dehydrogenase subunit delta [Luminiphilus sp.]
MTLDYTQQHLIKMANQIAENMPTRENVADQIAEHMLRFWSPSMCSDLAKIASEAPESLHEDVRAALAASD